MTGVVITGAGFEVDAALVASAFGLDQATLQTLMRSGGVTSLYEMGMGTDAGRHRLTFRHGARVLRLTVDGTGAVLAKSTFDAPRPGQTRA